MCTQHPRTTNLHLQDRYSSDFDWRCLTFTSDQIQTITVLPLLLQFCACQRSSNGTITSSDGMALCWFAIIIPLPVLSRNNVHIYTAEWPISDFWSVTDLFSRYSADCKTAYWLCTQTSISGARSQLRVLTHEYSLLSVMSYLLSPPCEFPMELPAGIFIVNNELPCGTSATVIWCGAINKKYENNS